MRESRLTALKPGKRFIQRQNGLGAQMEHLKRQFAGNFIHLFGRWKKKTIITEFKQATEYFKLKRDTRVCIIVLFIALVNHLNRLLKDLAVGQEMK